MTLSVFPTPQEGAEIMSEVRLSIVLSEPRGVMIQCLPSTDVFRAIRMRDNTLPNASRGDAHSYALVPWF